MNTFDRLSTATIIITALVQGCAFALVTALYLLVGGLFSQHLWCVFVGFFLTMALGAKPEKALNYICSVFAGYFWAFLYMSMDGWLASLLGLPISLCPVLSEFLLTASLLFIHLKPLAGTRVNTLPAIFAAIAATYGSGSLTRMPYCAASVLIGIGMAYGTGWAISRMTCRRRKGEAD